MIKDIKAHLTRQFIWSRATFGPAPRTKGVLDHIEKERDEVLAAKTPRERTKEWTDIAILGLDGLMRSIKEQYPHHTADMVAATALRLILGKQQRNEARDWPDWRTMPEDVAIEHSRTAKEQAEKDRELRGKKSLVESFDPDAPTGCPASRAEDDGDEF